MSEFEACAGNGHLNSFEHPSRKRLVFRLCLLQRLCDDCKIDYRTMNLKLQEGPWKEYSSSLAIQFASFGRNLHAKHKEKFTSFKGPSHCPFDRYLITNMFHKSTCYKASRMFLHSTHKLRDQGSPTQLDNLPRARGTTNHLSLPEDKHPKTLWIPILVVPILGETLPMP